MITHQKSLAGMFLLVLFNETSKHLHTHKKVILTLPTKQRGRNYFKKCAVFQFFIKIKLPGLCTIFLSCKEKLNKDHSRLWLLSPTVNAVEVPDGSDHIYQVMPTLYVNPFPELCKETASSNWNQSISTVQTHWQGTHVGLRELQEHKGRQAVFDEQHFWFPDAATTHLPSSPWDLVGWPAVSFMLCSQGSQRMSDLWEPEMQGNVSVMLKGATRYEKNILLFKDEAVPGCQACKIQQYKGS